MTELSFVVLVVTPLAVSLLNGLMLEVLDIEAISTLDDACWEFMFEREAIL